jgi:hypothetical protein
MKMHSPGHSSAVDGGLLLAGRHDGEAPALPPSENVALLT